MGIKIHKADKLFSKLVKKRDMYICQVCRIRKATQCHHHFGRGRFSVRFDMDNAIGICGKCHMDFHANPYEQVIFWKKRLGDKRYEALLVKANMIEKRDFKLAEIKLKALGEE